MPITSPSSLPTWSLKRLSILVLFGLLLKVLWSGDFFGVFVDNYSIANYTYTNNKVAVNDYCLCYGENFCYKGLDENGAYTNGRPFNCSLYEGLEERGLLDKDAAKAKNDFESLDKDSWNPTFVAPISSGHFAEGRLLVKSITTFYPDSKIVIYDIGITEEHIEEIKTWCNVLYRKFKFGQYPPHVRRLSSYAFKMINVEAFQEFKTFFYIDTSIRFTGRNLHIFLQGVKNKDLLPFSIHTDPKHSVYASTDPRMYEYLPLPKIIGYMFEFQSGFQFVTDSPYTRYVFKWWYLCAMTENCVAPVGAISHCKPKEYRETRYTYMKCHRFDQAFYNIAELTYLFGETRGALEFNYIDRNWTNIDLDLVLKVEDTRNRTMQKYFNTIRIDRFSRMRNRLVLECKNEQ